MSLQNNKNANNRMLNKPSNYPKKTALKNVSSMHHTSANDAKKYHLMRHSGIDKTKYNKFDLPNLGSTHPWRQPVKRRFHFLDQRHAT